MKKLEDIDKIANAITEKFSREGKIIEVGWQALRLMSVPTNACDIQLKEMRNCFFAGAQHLFASILNTLDPGREPTDKDLHRMTLIQKELDDFILEYKRENLS